MMTSQPQPLKSYPSTRGDDLRSALDVLDKISQIRADDQTKWDNLTQQFILGRRVAKVPTSSSDTSGSAVGDFNVTTTFAYYCVNNAGTAQWVRVAVGTF